MSATGTARLSEEARFNEAVSDPAGIKANPVVAASAQRPAVRPTLTISDARPVAADMRRHISPQSGRALEILGHAIEYLADEFTQQAGTSWVANDPDIQAVHILMEANRSVYFDCPTVPTLRERFRDLWRSPRSLLHG